MTKVKKNTEISKESMSLESIESKILTESIESEIPNWYDNIKQESLDNALKIGVILPQFKPYKNTVYTIILTSEPKYVNNEKGKFHSINIERDNMKYSLNMNGSFKFQLKLFLIRNKYTLKELIQMCVPLHISKDDFGFFTIQKV